MAIVAGKWSDEWTATLKTYEKANDASGKKRKVASKTKWWATSSKSEITRAFADLDKAYAAVDQANSPASLKALMAAAKSATSHGAKYTAVLAKQMQKEDKEGQKNKDLRSDYEKNISILKKDIKACLASAAAALQDKANDLKSNLSADDTRQALVKRATAAVREAGVALAKTAKQPEDSYAYNQNLSQPLFALAKALDALGKAAPEKGVQTQLAVLATTAKDLADPKLASFTGDADADIKTARDGIRKQLSIAAAYLKSVAKALKSL